MVPRTLAAGLFVTPNLGDSILADPRLAPLAALPDGVRSPEALRYLVQVNIARGVDLIKTRSTERAGLAEQDPRVQVYDERQIRAVVDAARRLRGGVACHGHGDEGIRDSVLAGVRSVEHGTFASAATLDLMRARGTYLVPTLSAVVDLAEPGGEYTDPRLVAARARDARRTAGDRPGRLRARDPDRRGNRHVVQPGVAVERSRARSGCSRSSACRTSTRYARRPRRARRW